MKSLSNLEQENNKIIDLKLLNAFYVNDSYWKRNIWPQIIYFKLPVLACAAIVLDFPHQPGRLSSPELLFEFASWNRNNYSKIQIEFLNKYYPLHLDFNINYDFSGEVRFVI